MQLASHPPISIPAPIHIPSAPVLPEHRLVFGTGSNPGTLEEPPSKKRKKDRACDYCRRRKIKCDGPWRQGQVCTNCIHGHRGCTYLESSRPRGPPKAYVTSLEDKVEQLEEALNKLFPNTDFTEELGPPIVRGSWKNGPDEQSGRPLKTSVSRITNQYLRSSLTSLNKPKAIAVTSRDRDFPMSQVDRTTHLIFKPLQNSKPFFASRKVIQKPFAAEISEDTENESAEEAVETGMGGRHRYGLNAIESGDDPAIDSRIRFHGRSSTASLVEVTRTFKHMCIQEKASEGSSKAQNLSAVKLKENSGRGTTVEKPDNAELQMFRRLEFWSTAKWEIDWNSYNSHAPGLVAELLKYFPPEPVANELVELFFVQSNTYLPLLHRPTFERYWREHLHHENVWFATLCILMFAVATRWYELGGKELNNWLRGVDEWKGAGWRWFFIALDVHCIRRSLPCPASLLEVQTFALMVLFLRGTTCVAVGWLFVSIGLRKAQDRGAHRRTVYRNYPNADDELWKRAFWLLLAFDHVLGASLGRGIATGQEDYDLDFPLEVDDEYWDTGNVETNFKQPSHVPSKITAFTQYIKLTEIIAFTAKTLYPVDKRKVFFGFIQGDWTGEVVRQLKMALEEWVQKVPPHLRWGNENSDLVFSRQAASIHSLYYCVVMLVWRPFCPYNPIGIPRPEQEERHSTALSQCAKSLKACAGILEVELQRGLSNHPNMINVSLVCAGTFAILLYVLQRRMVDSGRGKTLIRNYEIEETGIFISDLLDAVEVCMRVLTQTKSAWEYAEVVTEQLKAALPSGEDKSFESLDIPMPKVQGIADVMRVPGHLSSNPSRFQIPPDATFSFTDPTLYQMDSFQTGYSHSTSSVSTVEPPPTNSYSVALGPNSPHCPRSATPFVQNPHPPSSSATSRIDYSIPSSRAQPTIIKVGQSSRFSCNERTPYTRPEMTQTLQLQKHQSRLPNMGFVAPKPQARGSTAEKTAPAFPRLRVSSNAYSGDRTHALFSSESAVEDTIQVKDRPCSRTRTLSLVNEPSPVMAARKEFQCASSSLRRTSFPDLQTAKNASYVGSPGPISDRPAQDNVSAVSYGEPSSGFPGARRLPPLAPEFNRPPDSSQTHSINRLTGPRSRINFIPYDDQGTGERNEHKSDRSMVFNSWDERPSPPSTSNQHYTRHQFVHPASSGR